MSDMPEQQYSSALDYTVAYKVILVHFYWFRYSSNELNMQKYTIFCKMPMLVTRQEWNLAIDGMYYIHVRSLLFVLHVMFVLTTATNTRSCPPIKPMLSLIARKQLPTISRAPWGPSPGYMSRGFSQPVQMSITLNFILRKIALQQVGPSCHSHLCITVPHVTTFRPG